MTAKIVLVFCAHAAFIQQVFTQCVNRGPIPSGPFGPMPPAFGPMSPHFASIGSPLNPTSPSAFSKIANRNRPDKFLDTGVTKSLSCGTPVVDITVTSGGNLPVTSSSPIAPTGISVISENAYEGALTAAGEVPFVGSTAVDGVLPTAGAGATNYGCGDGVTAMVSEVATPAAAIAPAALITPTATPASITSAGLSSNLAPAGLSTALNAARFGGCGRGLMR